MAKIATYKKARSKNKISYNEHVLVVSRSNRNILVQVLEPVTKKTLATFTSYKTEGMAKTDKSKKVGGEVAEFLSKNNINRLVFDRNGYIYHGRIKAILEEIRTKGITI